MWGFEVLSCGQERVCGEPPRRANRVRMSLSVTLCALLLTLGIGALCAWRGAAEPNPHRGPRLIPYRFLMVLCGALLLYLAAHVLSLLGVTTGAR
ncbi:MAG: hypothetical protein JWP49_1066 [Phenylobacterium sp.]|nr:hypothetical protein [Phenylobacterium sp.]